MKPAVDDRFDGRLRDLPHLISNRDRKELRGNPPIKSGERDVGEIRLNENSRRGEFPIVIRTGLSA